MTRAHVWILTVRPLREPFVHFLILGAVLFGLYALLQPKHAASGDSRQVILMRGDIDHLRLGFAAEWRRSPSAAEMQALLNDRINEEVLYREGLALGLDRDDTVVRRRLAQKTQFLLLDVAGLREPTAEDLARYQSQNAHRYSQGPRWTFEHIYFSTASRNERAELDAREALAQLRNAEGDIGANTLGDPSLLDLARPHGARPSCAIFLVRSSRALSPPCRRSLWGLGPVRFDRATVGIWCDWKPAASRRAKTPPTSIAACGPTGPKNSSVSSMRKP
ncbi:hypothetical protein PQR08_32385 [Caballeronia jiangsuensis]|uniref:Peptidyl-prolyl cis-trans isomerase n=1 Tax=Caballeronia jiangsuensis TaxID=1458357 RepID=A0ABW9CUE7_9BURK